MALSLALGLGLQGTPKDYVDVYRSRQKGADAAKAKAAKEEDDRLEPFRKRMISYTGGKYLPMHEKEVMDAEANVYAVLSDNVSNPNYEQVGQTVSNFIGLAQRRQSDRKQFDQAQTTAGNHDPRAIKALENMQDPNEISKATNRMGGSIFVDPATRNVSFNPYAQKDLGEEIGKSLNQENKYDWTNPKASKIMSLGGKKIAVTDLSPQAIIAEKQRVLTDPVLKRNLYREVDSYLDENNINIDTSTPDGEKDYTAAVNTFLDNKIDQISKGLKHIRGADETKGFVVNNYTGDQTNALNPMSPSTTTINVGKNNYPVVIKGYYAPGNYKSMTASGAETFDLNTQESLGTGVLNITYNGVGAAPVATQDVTITRAEIKKASGVDYGKDVEIKKGRIVNSKEAYDYLKSKGLLTAQFTAFGQTDDQQSIYQPANTLTPTQYNALSKDEKANYDSAIAEQNALMKELKSGSKGTPAAAATTTLRPPTVKTIKASDIPAKAKAVNKTVEEYTKLLKQNGVTITN